MLDFITYDFGYSWSVRYAMIAPLIVAGSLAALAAWRSWPRWVFIVAALMALWAAAAVVVLNVMLNSPMPLPTERFLRAGAGRVLDVGAGSGRAAVGVLIARPHVTATGVDIYSGYWGIDGNTPERFMANAQIAGVADRASARVGDMRQLPFGDGEFDAVVSSYAIDHLPRAERPKAIAEVARVLKAGGEFLLMIIRVDWRTWLVRCSRITRRRTRNPGANCFSSTDSAWRKKARRLQPCTSSPGSTVRDAPHGRRHAVRISPVPSHRIAPTVSAYCPRRGPRTRRDGGPIIRDVGASAKSRVRANPAPADAVVHVDVVVGDRQSARRPSRGDIRVARAAGREAAANATTPSASTDIAKLRGSFGCSPKSSVPAARPMASASAQPIPSPTASRSPAWPSISRRTSPLAAPSAMRMAISLDRRATEYDITPYSPTAASSAASTPKKPDSQESRRSRVSRSRTCTRSVCRSPPTTFSSRNSCRRLAATLSAGPVVRRITFMLRRGLGCCDSGAYAVGGMSSRRSAYFESPTVPTIS